MHSINLSRHYLYIPLAKTALRSHKTPLRAILFSKRYLSAFRTQNGLRRASARPEGIFAYFAASKK